MASQTWNTELSRCTNLCQTESVESLIYTVRLKELLDRSSPTFCPVMPMSLTHQSWRLRHWKCPQARRQSFFPPQAQDCHELKLHTGHQVDASASTACDAPKAHHFFRLDSAVLLQEMGAASETFIFSFGLTTLSGPLFSSDCSP